MKFLLLSFLAGLVAALGFEPLGIWVATVVGFAGLLRLVEQAPRLRSALARGWWFGVGHFVLGLNWIATAFTYQSAMPAWLGWVSVGLLSLYLAVYPAMAAGLAWRHGRVNRTAFVLIYAAAWIVTEWLRATVFTGFAWNPAAVTLVDTPLAKVAPWIGTYGMSGLLVVFAGALMLASTRDRTRALPLFAAIIGLALVAPLVSRAALPGSNLPIRVVQPNIGQQDKWTPGFEERNFAQLARLSGPGSNAPRILLWPEAAVTNPLQDDRANSYDQGRAARVRAKVANLLGPRDLLLTGGVTLRSRDGIDVTSATNSVFAMDPKGSILARYDKAHLVPYGEYLPMRPVLSKLGLSRLAPGDVDFDSGPGPRTIAVPGMGKVGFQLCYEIIFSGQVVDPAQRPDFIFNPSNDAWFGAWGPPQHLAQARLRAIEEGLPVLRATPTGNSAVIDAEGRLLHSLAWRTEGAIDARLPSAKPPTLFARTGNAMAFLVALLLIGIAIAVTRKAR